MDNVEDIEKEINDSSSDAAAGIIRGLSRTIQLTLRRVVVGSIPQQKIDIRSIAKLSDRLGNVFDLGSQAYDVLHQPTDSGTTKGGTTNHVNNLKWRSFGIKVYHFGVSVAKNSILGAAVFSSYDSTIEYFQKTQIFGSIIVQNSQQQTSGRLMTSSSSPEEDASSRKSSIVVEDMYSKTSLPGHFVAGLAAGTVHSCLHHAIESISTRARSTMFMLSMSTFHHSLAHSILFGGYETLKRSFMYCLNKNGDDRNILYKGLHSEKIEEEGLLFALNEHVVAVSLAGGLAGQLQYIISHYTEPLEVLKSWKHVLVVQRSALTALPLPAMRPLLIAFPANAFAFLAFEYGKEWSNNP